MSLLVVLILFGVAWYFLNKYLYGYWKRHGLEQLEPAFFVGSTGKLIIGQSSFFETFRDLYRKSKGHKVIGFYSFYKPSILINDPKIIHDICIRDFNHFHDHNVEFDLDFDPLNGNLFSLTGKKWRDLRVKLSPAFTSGKLRWMFPVMKSCSDLLVDFIDKGLKNHDNELVINDMFKRYNANVISSVAFGIDNDCINNENNDFYKYGNKFFDATFGNMFRFFLFLFMPKYMSTLRFKFAQDDVNDFFLKLTKEIVEYREKNNFHRNDFMDLLIQLKNQGYVSADKDDDEVNNNGYNDDVDDEFKNNRNEVNSNVLQKLDINEVAAQAFVFFLAAFETNSAPMTFVILELAKNPDIQRKVHEEIDKVFSTEGITYDSLKNLKYLECCLLESLRKYPPVPLLQRQCTKDYKIRDFNFTIKNGTDVKIPVMSMHRDPEIYDEPLKFIPERFLDSPTGGSKLDNKNGILFYLPFGDGPRHCIGMRMAKANAMLILAALLSNYKFSLVNEKLYHEEIQFDPKSFPLRPVRDIKVRLEKRQMKK